MRLRKFNAKKRESKSRIHSHSVSDLIPKPVEWAHSVVAEIPPIALQVLVSAL